MKQSNINTNNTWIITIEKVKKNMNSTLGAIGDCHDGVIWLQLPGYFTVNSESFTFSVSYANQGNCHLNPTGNSKFK